MGSGCGIWTAILRNVKLEGRKTGELWPRYEYNKMFIHISLGSSAIYLSLWFEYAHICLASVGSWFVISRSYSVYWNKTFQAPISCTGGVQFFSSPPASPVIYNYENMLHELVDTARFLERKQLRAKQVVSRRIPRLRLTRQNPSHAVFSNKEHRTRICNSAATGLGIRLWLL